MIPTRDIRNVIADTIERIYEEYGSKLDRTNCLAKAEMITVAIKYGIGGYDTVRLHERELKYRLCQKHK